MIPVQVYNMPCRSWTSGSSTSQGAHRRHFLMLMAVLPDLRHCLTGASPSTFFALMVDAAGSLSLPPRGLSSTFFVLLVGAPGSPSPPLRGPAIDVLCVDGGRSRTSGTASQGSAVDIFFVAGGRSRTSGTTS
jgi:hypothetical protein